jgi:adenylate cyclase
VGLTDESFIQFGDVVFPPLEANDGGYVRTDASGYQVLLNFRGPSCLQDKTQCPYQMFSMTEVLEHKIPPQGLRDRIVLIGSTAESLNDFFFTPYSSGIITSPEPTAGVEIHANLVSQILEQVLADRPSVKTWSDPVEWLWIFAWSVLGSTVTWKLRYYSGTNKISFVSSASLFLAGCSLLGISYVAFLDGLWIPVAPALIGLLGSAIAIQGYIARSAGEIRKTFGRYLNDGVIANLLESPDGFQLGGENRTVTLLLSDLRGFTALAKPLPPEKVVHLLNIYLERMCQIIEEYNGTIDKFIGDAILVIFGAPTRREDDPDRAVACAIAMQTAMQDINQQLRELNLPFIEMGIGIHTGEVVVGNIGSQKHAEYTVIGSEVNLVSRIESYTVGGQVLISEATLNQVVSTLRVDAENIVNPKGFNQEITLYEVGGMSGKYTLFMPKPEKEMFSLTTEIPLTYTILDGKHISHIQYRGTLVKYSEYFAQIKTERLIESLTNIKINLDLNPNSESSSEDEEQEEEIFDIYAKVVKKTSVYEYFFLIRFTSMPPEIMAKVSSFY